MLLIRFFDEYKVQKHSIEIQIICNIINDRIVTFDQYTTSLLNKSTFSPPKHYIYNICMGKERIIKSDQMVANKQ